MLRNLFKEIAPAFLVFAATLFLFDVVSENFPLKAALDNTAAVFSVDTVTPEILRDKYEEPASEPASQEEAKIKIFIMAGHEPSYGGAEYRTLKERNINLIISRYLKEFLETDPKFEVVEGRDKDGWNPDLAAYFKENWEAIKQWKEVQEAIMKRMVEEQEISIVADHMPHQTVATDVGTRLYGINKWVGERAFDLAIHIHVNDYGSHRYNQPGEFTGYVIYVPQSQYSNSLAAREVAKDINQRLNKFIGQSTAKREKGGLVEDQELVALGRYNTADAPSMLIEYGYIYEQQFQDKTVLESILKEYAYQTYLGIRDFFAPTPLTLSQLFTATLPYTWKKDLRQGPVPNVDVFALQMALAKEGIYPPSQRSFNDCPISGLFGECTRNALMDFQRRYSLRSENGYVGEKTREKLNILFGQ